MLFAAENPAVGSVEFWASVFAIAGIQILTWYLNNRKMQGQDTVLKQQTQDIGAIKTQTNGLAQRNEELAAKASRAEAFIDGIAQGKQEAHETALEVAKTVAVQTVEVAVEKVAEKVEHVVEKIKSSDSGILRSG